MLKVLGDKMVRKVNRGTKENTLTRIHFKKSAFAFFIIGILFVSIIQSASANDPPAPVVVKDTTPWWQKVANTLGSIGGGAAGGLGIGGLVGGAIGCLAGPGGCVAGAILGASLGGLSGAVIAPLYNGYTGKLTGGTSMENIVGGLKSGAVVGIAIGAIAGGVAAYAALANLPLLPLILRSSPAIIQRSTIPILTGLGRMAASADKIPWIAYLGGSRSLALVGGTGVILFTGNLIYQDIISNANAPRQRMNPLIPPILPPGEIPSNFYLITSGGSLDYPVIKAAFCTIPNCISSTIEKAPAGPAAGSGDPSIQIISNPPPTLSVNQNLIANTIKTILQKVNPFGNKGGTSSTGGTGEAAPAGGATGGKEGQSANPVASAVRKAATATTTNIKRLAGAVKKAISPSSSKLEGSTPYVAPKTNIQTSISQAEAAGTTPPGIVPAITPSLPAGGTAPVSIAAALPSSPTGAGGGSPGSGGVSSGGIGGGAGAGAGAGTEAPAPTETPKKDCDTSGVYTAKAKSDEGTTARIEDPKINAEECTVSTEGEIVADSDAEPGVKETDIDIQKDGNTVKIVRLGTEIQPDFEFEQGAPGQGKAVIWIILLLTISSGALIALVWRYKHLKNIEEESAIKPESTEIPQTQSAIAYMFGI